MSLCAFSQTVLAVPQQGAGAALVTKTTKTVTTKKTLA